MALTLIDANKLSTDVLQKGVVATFTENSEILDRLPFVEVEGNGYAYNLVDELPNVDFRAVNQGYVEDGASISRQYETLCILGGDVDTDVFIAQTRGNINDIRAIETELKCKALAEKYTQKFFHGDVTHEGNSFDGLIKRVDKGIGKKISKTLTLPKTQTEALAVMDVLYDLLAEVKNQTADVIYISPKNERIISRAMLLLGYQTGTGVDAFGKKAIMFNGIPLTVVPEALGDQYIVAVKLGGEFVSGLTNGGVKARDLGEAHDKPVLRTRVEFYCGVMAQHPKSFAIVDLGA